MRLWILRCAALLAFAAVLWFAGPRAWTRLAARVDAATSLPPVDLDRVGLRRAPTWLTADPALARAVLEELSPRLQGGLRRRDREGAVRLQAGLAALSWVATARLLEAGSSGFELQIELRRPVIEVFPAGPVAGKVARVLVDRHGVCLRPASAAAPAALPRVELTSGVIPGSLPVYRIGEEHPDPRVRAAATVAAEWRDEMQALVPAAPPLVLIDASNHGGLLLPPGRHGEVLVGLAAADGETVIFEYGHAPTTPLPRVPIADKARVLEAILARHPGLTGLQRGDLRFVNLWSHWLIPRPPRVQ